MKICLYIDPEGEPRNIIHKTPEGDEVVTTIRVPWRTEDVPVDPKEVGRDLTFESESGEYYKLRLRFRRKGVSNRYYLVGIVDSTWDNADLEQGARTC